MSHPAMFHQTAGIMLTNPSTIGVFERHIRDVAKIVHDAGGLLYYDGANLNAILGKVRPGDVGFDAIHMNLHKTFSTPPGGGGSVPLPELPPEGPPSTALTVPVARPASGTSAFTKVDLPAPVDPPTTASSGASMRAIRGST